MGSENGAGTVEQIAEIVGKMFHIESIAGHILVFYHIESGSGNLLLLDGFGQVGSTHYGPARGVDKVERVREIGDEVAVDHVMGFGGEGNMEAQDIGVLLEVGE